jgi:hypothetical protein
MTELENPPCNDDVTDLYEWTVFDRWAHILKELPAVGKERFNAAQKFNYRGIDDVINAAKKLLGTYGVFIVPTAQETSYSERATMAGNALYVCKMRVDWRIYGVQGDYFDAQTVGEGADSFDKATSKAQTAAFKYLLWPALFVAEHDADADGETPDETRPSALGQVHTTQETLEEKARRIANQVPLATQTQLNKITLRQNKLDVNDEALKTKGVKLGILWPDDDDLHRLTEDEADKLIAVLK